MKDKKNKRMMTVEEIEKKLIQYSKQEMHPFVMGIMAALFYYLGCEMGSDSGKVSKELKMFLEMETGAMKESQKVSVFTKKFVETVKALIKKYKLTEGMVFYLESVSNPLDAGVVNKATLRGLVKRKLINPEATRYTSEGKDLHSFLVHGAHIRKLSEFLKLNTVQQSIVLNQEYLKPL